MKLILVLLAVAAALATATADNAKAEAFVPGKPGDTYNYKGITLTRVRIGEYFFLSCARAGARRRTRARRPFVRVAMREAQRRGEHLFPFVSCVLPCPALPCPALLCPTLSCPALSSSPLLSSPLPSSPLLSSPLLSSPLLSPPHPSPPLPSLWMTSAINDGAANSPTRAPSQDHAPAKPSRRPSHVRVRPRDSCP